MQFYRKCLNKQDFIVPTTVEDNRVVPHVDQITTVFSDFIDSLYSFGFTDLTHNTKPSILLTTSGYGRYIPAYPLCFSWHQDSNKINNLDSIIDAGYLPANSFCFSCDGNVTLDNFYYVTFNQNDASLGTSKLLRIHGFGPGATQANHGGGFPTKFIGFWFIPLKNGFLIQVYSCPTPYEGNVCFNTAQMFFNPPLLFCDQVNKMVTGEYLYANFCQTGTILGLYNYTTNIMNYIAFCTSANHDYHTPLDYADDNFCQTNNWFTNTSSIKPDPRQLINTMSFLDRELEYTNVQANNCVLIKYPYEDRFLDGIYICSTAPTAECLEGKFFSFNSRNFLGVHKNLVVELTSN